MALNVDLRTFLDEQGHVVELTEQAEMVFLFLVSIISAVSKKHLDVDELMPVDLACNTRAHHLSCSGNIEAGGSKNGTIEWQCDTCEAAGIISHWQATNWDKQRRVFH